MLKPIIYLDQDGVLADFEGWAANQFTDWKREINSPNWGAFANYQNLFELLPLMPYAKELYNECVELVGDVNQVQILTALPNRAHILMPHAARNKIEWAREHINPNIRVHFGPYAQDKQYHFQHEHDILIDDMQINIEQWEDVGGSGILYVNNNQAIVELEKILTKQGRK